MDMSGAYACSVRAHAPHAILTFDRFHVAKLMNERLDDLRRELARNAQERTAKEAIKGCDGCCCIAGTTEKDRQAVGEAWKSINLSNAHTCSKELGELWQRTMGVSLGLPARMGRESHRQRNPPTPGHGKNPPPPHQGNPELLPHRFDQRKMEESTQIHRLLASAFGFATTIFSNCASTLFMKPSSPSSAKPSSFPDEAKAR